MTKTKYSHMLCRMPPVVATWTVISSWKPSSVARSTATGCAASKGTRGWTPSRTRYQTPPSTVTRVSAANQAAGSGCVDGSACCSRTVATGL